MSDPKPDRILAEESDNPWVKLILWSNEDPVRPIHRWKGFMKYLAEERLSLLDHLNLTDEQCQPIIEFLRIDSEHLKREWSLLGEVLEHAKNFFPNDTNFKQDQQHLTFDHHIFSKELNFNGAIFLRPISFKNCYFKRPVNFHGARFEFSATFSDSTFSKKVEFRQAQFRVAALFDRVTFCREVNFYSQPTDDNFAAIFRNAIFKKMTPVFHGRNFHPACDFHGVTWPEISTRNHPIQTENTIETALKNL